MEKMKFKDEILLDGQTLFNDWWSALKFTNNCTFWLSINNFYFAKEHLKYTLEAFKGKDKELDDYLKEQKRIIELIGDVAVLDFVQKFEASKKPLSSIIILNQAQNLKLRLYQGFVFDKKMDVANEILDVCAFSQYRKQQGKEIMLVTSMDELIEFIDETGLDVPYRDIRTSES